MWLWSAENSGAFLRPRLPASLLPILPKITCLVLRNAPTSPAQRRHALDPNEKQRRVTKTEGEETVTRQSYQQGYVSKPIPTRCGTVFKIRYRVKSADGKWNHKTETLYGISGKKAARAVLDERIREVSVPKPEGSDLSLRAFVDAWWKPYLQRKGVKLSTKNNYDSVLQLHILPVFGDLRIEEIVPLHVERFMQTKLESGLSAKTVRNLLLVLQAILSLAVDNDLIARSPIRKRHKPTVFL
jgi:hypothetical protein